MDITPEFILGAIAIIGTVIGVWVRVNSALKVMEQRIDVLEKMVEKQIMVDEKISYTLEDLKIGHAVFLNKLEVISKKIDG